MMPLSYYFIVKVYDRQRNLIECLQWTDMRYEIRLKWDWYFRYRAALLQVKYPRCEVQTFFGSEEPSRRTQQQILLNKARAKQRKLTQYKNLLGHARKDWNSLFPIEEDLLFQKAINKIQTLETELKTLQNQLS